MTELIQTQAIKYGTIWSTVEIRNWKRVANDPEEIWEVAAYFSPENLKLLLNFQTNILMKSAAALPWINEQIIFSLKDRELAGH